MAGLVSVTFRPLAPRAVLAAAKAAGLDTIEWGGDVHVPAGDPAAAERVRRLTEGAGVKIFAYGSYYRMGASPAEDFAPALASARILDAPILRVWAYNKGSAQTEPAEYAKAVADARRICALAQDRTICLECHNGTLTDTPASALRFLQDAGCPNLKLYWQPNQYRTFEENLASAAAMAPHCKGVHVFAWDGDRRLPLAAHTERWRRYAEIIRAASPTAEFLLEFMRDDRPESLPEAAGTLKKILGQTP